MHPGRRRSRVRGPCPRDFIGLVRAWPGRHGRSHGRERTGAGRPELEMRPRGYGQAMVRHGPRDLAGAQLEMGHPADHSADADGREPATPGAPGRARARFRALRAAGLQHRASVPEDLRALAETAGTWHDDEHELTCAHCRHERARLSEVLTWPGPRARASTSNPAA